MRFEIDVYLKKKATKFNILVLTTQMAYFLHKALLTILYLMGTIVDKLICGIKAIN
jgi:hypothetical protein